jgi:two-component system phosphate regulon sensor histidine kinase PhoR
MASEGAGARRARVDDTARERTVLLNQSLLAGVALLAVVLVLMFGQVRAVTPLVLACAIVFVATGAAMIVPWNRLPHVWGALIPVADIIAIAFLRDASPTAGLGILWAFPVMWISWLYGVAGVVLSVVGVSSLFWLLVGADPAQSLSTSTLLLPVTIAAVATIAYLASRRALAQRYLLDKQSRHLQQSVDRARRQEDIVMDVLDAVDFGVIRIAPDGTLAVTNEAHARLQGSRDHKGETVAYGADGVTRLTAEELPLVRARRGDVFENELVWYGDPGDDRRALSITARQISDLDGSFAGTIVVSRDVTNEELALRAREDLVASVSHELRTPLTSIMGYLDLVLDDDELSPAARRNLEVAERNAGRLLELVADILTVSAVSRKGIDLSIDAEVTDLSDVVREAVESQAPRAAERRITIDDSGIEETIAYADAHRIRQVIDNLVSNAIKYNNDGGHVEVGATSDGLHAWIVVRDDGPGISEQELPRLFERFFRSDSVRKSTTHGSGLGLAISRDIVRAHGGEITVQTRPGDGCTFIVRLPTADPKGEA